MTINDSHFSMSSSARVNGQPIDTKNQWLNNSVDTEGFDQLFSMMLGNQSKSDKAGGLRNSVAYNRGAESGSSLPPWSSAEVNSNRQSATHERARETQASNDSGERPRIRQNNGESRPNAAASDDASVREAERQAEVKASEGQHQAKADNESANTNQSEQNQTSEPEKTQTATSEQQTKPTLMDPVAQPTEQLPPVVTTNNQQAQSPMVDASEAELAPSQGLTEASRPVTKLAGDSALNTKLNSESELIADATESDAEPNAEAELMVAGAATDVEGQQPTEEAGEVNPETLVLMQAPVASGNNPLPDPANLMKDGTANGDEKTSAAAKLNLEAGSGSGANTDPETDSQDFMEAADFGELEGENPSSGAKTANLENQSGNKQGFLGVATTPMQERLAMLAQSLDPTSRQRLNQAAADTASSKVAAADGKAVVIDRPVAPQARAEIAATKPALLPINAPLLSRDWANELGQRVVMMTSRTIQSAQIQVNPQNLGPIDVKVSMQQDQAQVVFTSQVALTRETIEQALPRLREMLEQNGVTLADVDVRDQSSNQSEANSQGQSGQPATDDPELTADAESQEIEITSPIGLVDYYA